jgi:gliding motility-associated-like protein
VNKRLPTIWLLVAAFVSALLPLVISAQNASVEHAQPIKYIENKQQWEAPVLYKTQIGHSTLYLEKNAITFDLVNAEDLLHEHHPGTDSTHAAENHSVRHHAYKMIFENANPETQLTHNKQSKEYYNYFLGNNPQKWSTFVYGYGEVTYKKIYNGIDLKWYSSGEHIKYDFIVQRGADVNQIQITYKGTDGLELKDGNLIIHNTVNTITESKPYAYQYRNGQITVVNCDYEINGNTVSFVFPDGYNKNLELFIDPELVFASYTGASADNWGYTATNDDDGNLFGGGIVFSSGYPTTVGAFQTSYQGGQCDVGISKFSADGSSLIYSTYLGGNNSELPHSMIANSDGELVILGTTGSNDWPTTAGAYDATYNGGPPTLVDEYINFSGADIYVTKLSADGTALIGSTYIGGSGLDGMNTASGYTTYYNYGDFARGEVMIDAADNIYIASSTNSSSFPTTAGAFQTILAGDQEGVVFKMNSTCSSLIWSTFIGGEDEDGAYSIKINSDNEPIVAGGTASGDFPVTPGSWHSTYLGGTADGWIIRLEADGSDLIAGTFVGTNQYDQNFFVEVDDADNIYFTGQTKGSFPVTPGVYSEANGKQYIGKINPDLTAPIYTTIFGSGSSAVNITLSAFLVDECENVYVSGWGGTVNQLHNPSTGSTSGMTVTPDAIQATTDGSDFYFYVLSKNAVDLLFASYFGGNFTAEHVDGGTSRFDKSGAIYQAVCAGCGGSDGFPTTDGAYSETNGSVNCNLGVIKIEFNLAGIYAAAIAEPSLIGCAPFDVEFSNTSIGAVDYIWDFGDGSPTTSIFEPSHTYLVPGDYTVMLIAIDSNSCNIADTAYLSVIVLSDDIDATFEYTTVENCDSLTATFSLMEDFLPTTTFAWDFGDGTTSTLSNPTHSFTEPGVYTITLTVEDPTSCNGIDTFFATINYLIDFNEGFTFEALGCLPIDATFTANYVGESALYWDFDDGTTGEGASVTHTYDTPGVYNVALIAENCGVQDTVIIPVIIDDLPIAYFADEPYYIIANTYVAFNNLSEHAVSYEWTFSDGGSTTEENGKHFFEELGIYDVCLTAYNTNGCSDIYCRTVEAVGEGVIDIPTAFTPNGDGINDVLYVQGIGIDDMQLLIYNRWGQLVFQTDDYTVGWDGTFKGTPQPLEVYVYTLIGDFTNGVKYERKGNITLLK